MAVLQHDINRNIQKRKKKWFRKRIVRVKKTSTFRDKTKNNDCIKDAQNNVWGLYAPGNRQK